MRNRQTVSLTNIFSSAFRLLLIVLATIYASHTVHADELSPFETTTVTIIGNDSAGPYALGRRFIDGTVAIDSLSVDAGITISDTFPLDGTIRFSLPLALSDTVTVTFAVPPQWLEESFERTEEQAYQEYDYYRAEQPRERATVQPRMLSGMSFGGSKTFDVNVGSNSETALNQTLRLNISGNLTDDIMLNAIISDQNVPISPEGDTRELEELDRVLIEVTGPRFNATMGDTDLRHQSGRWMNWERRLSGAQVGITAGTVEVYGAGAISEGRHMSTSLTPVEGNQGPYRLIAENGRNDITIIPGTESLWINGEQLTRGNSNDYTIDYTTGEVFFTERSIMGADMRIVADYEYTSESYLRNFYTAGTSGTFLDGRLTIDISAAREEDNSNKPVLYNLDTATKEALQQSGDSPAITNGITLATSDSTGTYDLVDNHLEYNPTGNGAWQARFSWVGETRGEYRYKGGGIYEWVPPDERLAGSGASYNPVAIIDGPASQSMAGSVITFNPVPSAHIEAELASSQTDLNTLSSIDDDDNDGFARRFSATYSPTLPFTVPMTADISVNHRSQDNRFNPLDRDRGAEENRDWGLPIIIETQKESVTDYSAGLTVRDGSLNGTGFSFNGGQATFGETSSNRIGGSGKINHTAYGSLTSQLNHIVRKQYPGIPDETIDRLRATTETTISGFRPKFRFEGERVEGIDGGTHGSAYADYRTSITSPEFYGITSNVEWFYRDEKSKQITWSDSAFVRGGSIALGSVRTNARSYRAQYSHRERVDAHNTVETDQALLNVSLRPENGIYRFNGNYRAGRSREASRRRNYIYVGADRGQYRWEDLNDDGIRDEDEFIPDIHGSYYLYDETLDDYRPVNLVSVNGSLNISVPEYILEKLVQKSLPVTSEFSFDITEKSTAPASDVFLLNVHRFRKYGSTVSGNSRLQQDLTVPFSEGAGSVRLRYFRYDAYNAEYVSGAERQRQEEQSIRIRIPVTEQYDAQCSITHTYWDRIMDERPTGDYHIDSYAGDGELSFYPSGPSKLGIALGGGRDHDSALDFASTYWQAKPSATYRFSGKGHIELSYTMTRVSLDRDVDDARIPYPMARGQKEGSNHDISLICDLRLSSRMNLIATYTGRKFGGRTFEHFARTQVRALF